METWYTVHVCNPKTREDGDRKILGVHWPCLCKQGVLGLLGDAISKKYTKR